MRTTATPLITAIVLLAGCPGSIVEYPQDGIIEEDPPPLELAVTSPAYGEFAGDHTIRVEGTVSPITAEVWVEDEVVEIAEDGSFAVDLTFEHAYLLVDVLATSGGDDADERIPVFAGNPPADSWTGSLTARLLPDGLDRLGPVVGPMIDGAGWASAIEGSLPAFQTTYLSMEPQGLGHGDTEVALAAAEHGIEVTATLNGVEVTYDLVISIGGSWSVPVVVGYEAVTITAIATPSLDADGVIWLTLTEAAIDLGDTTMEVSDLDAWIVTWLLDMLNDWVTEPLGGLLLEWLLGEYGTLELGGPIASETDLLGTTIAIELSGLESDLEGPGATLSIDMDGLEGISHATPMPIGDDAPDADLAVALHEALLDAAVSDGVLELLEQDIQLSGTFGDIIGVAVENLPGGGDIPDGDGWCVSLIPGTAHVARMQTGIDPLAVVYLPDLRFYVEREVDGNCDAWLSASLALEAGLTVTEGTQIGFDVTVAEGKVLSYKTDDDWDEAEVIEGLGDLIGSLVSLAGGFVEIDLADLLGGVGGEFGLEGLALSIVDSQPMVGENSEPIEGLFAVGVRLFEE